MPSSNITATKATFWSDLPRESAYLPDSITNFRPCVNVSTPKVRRSRITHDDLIFVFPFSGVQCGYPAEIPNGDYRLVNGTVNYLSQVVYTCNEGFQLQGRAELTCDLDERWDGPPPKCVGKWHDELIFVFSLNSRRVH